MPVLNYHKDDKALPDMNALQKCDCCGAEKIGNQMYFRDYGNNQIGVICQPCFLQVYGGPAPIAPPNTASTRQVAGLSYADNLSKSAATCGLR